MTRSTQKTRNARVLEVFRAFCIGVDSPRALKAALLVKYGEFEQLARMKIHPIEYCDSHTFAGDYAVVSFLKKNKDLPPVTDTRAAAIAAFKSSEDRCRQTNELLTAWTEGRLSISPRVVQVIHLAQRKISALLADHEPACDDWYSWGPGATFDLRRSEAYPDTKVVQLPFTVTEDALRGAASLINRDLHWKRAIIEANADYCGPIFEIVRGGRYDTVAKTVLTDRSIMVEPRLNSVLQKRIGAQLRALLKRVGVDLDDQSHNQVLAAFARRCHYATLDLEAASDTVSTKLVEILLPPAWFEAMDSCRSPEVQIDGAWVRLEKFSSMGNGFTFELESLIFWALAAASNELSHSTTLGVYGDDIIVHQRCVPWVREALETCGFRLNTEKSFVEGDFFESCGKHYFGDDDVTPLYQKESPDGLPSAIRLGNRILRFAARVGSPFALDKRAKAAYEAVRRIYEIPADRHGPFVGEGDGYLEAIASELSVSARASPFGLKTKVKCFVESPVEIPAQDEALLALWFAKVGQRGSTHALSRCLGGRPEAVARAIAKGLIPELKDVTSDRVAPGNVASRVNSRLKTAHRWVEITHIATSLAW